MPDTPALSPDQDPVRIGIVGASGYGGVQLVRVLTDHPRAQIACLAGRDSVGRKYGEIYPQLAPICNLPVHPVEVEAIAAACEVVFLALPNGLAAEIAPALVAKGCRVLDLSADYRFRDLSLYQAWYRPGHLSAPWPSTAHREANARAVYGLPEIYREQVSQASLIGCPGCYATPSLLAAAPLLRQGLVEPDSLIIDALIGISGAGRVPQMEALFAEVDGSIGAYHVANHRHTPEIEQICSELVHHPVSIQFTPHRVPMVRGTHVTVYASLRDPGLVAEDLLTIYTVFYRQSPWVRILPRGVYPQTKWVVGTNYCLIGLEVDSRTNRVIVLAATDNLLKGQAGQAVQCLNLMMGWPEILGLPQLGFYP